MIDFAERYFYLAQADGPRTRFETLTAQLARARKKRATKRVAELKAELKMPPFPDALAYVWRAYFRLRRRTAVGFAGPQPIGWQDIDAFLLRSGLRLAPWEIATIEAIDDIYMNPETPPKPTTPEGQSVTIAASAQDTVGVKAVIGSVGVRRVVKRKGS